MQFMLPQENKISKYWECTQVKKLIKEENTLKILYNSLKVEKKKHHWLKHIRIRWVNIGNLLIVKVLNSLNFGIKWQ